MRKKKKTEQQEINDEKLQRKRNKKTNREMAIVTYLFLGLFLVMIGFLVKFLAGDMNALLNNQYNKRQDLLAEQITKGSILSANGKILAKTETDKNGKETRYYPYGEVFAHVVGRSVNGKTGLEAAESYTMLTTNVNPVYGTMNQLKGEKNPGNNVVTTLHENLQKTAYQAMGSNKGAVVVMEPSTGKILAMVSTPSYDPNTVSRDWERLTSQRSENSALYNRATQGLYPPGSTFKLLMSLEYLRENQSLSDFKYRCTGKIGTGTDIIRCYGNSVHGTLTLERAFAKSCNTAFASIGTGLKIKDWTKLCNSLYFNKTLPISMEQKKASFTLKEGEADAIIRQTAIGQGDTLVTPLQNLLLVAACENDGKIMKPYVIDRIEDAYGNVVRQTEPEVMSSPITEEEASELKTLMEATVKYGTATALNYGSYHAGGKTGSAEFKLGSTESHSWFIGFAEKNGKKLVVSIIGEGAGTGSRFAVPVARKIFDAYW